MRLTPAAALLLLSSCSAAGTAAPAPLRFEERRLAMGSQARIALYASSREQADEAFAAAFARIERLEATLSDWRPDSELSRLNDAAGGPPRPVSADLLAALERSVELARQTGGAFDPTVGPLVVLWRRARAQGHLPRKIAIDAALERTRWDRIEVDDSHRTARLAKPGMRLDLGAIGKGLACDAALAMLRAKGCPVALVEIGGDLAAGDPPPGQGGWTVAAGPRLIQVANQGVAGSGDAEQHLDVDGVRYSHIVDPRTGIGVTGGLTTTVVAKDGTVADALATAANVLGPHEGRTLVEGAGARLFVDDPRMTSLFDGKTLAGWVAKGGHYDGDALWTVEDGCIVGRVNAKGEGGLLYTEKPYTSFVFECETRIDYPFDSGVFVRMAPAGKGAQVTLDDRPDGEIAAVYSDGFLMHNEAARAHWRKDEWNHVEVRVTSFDMHIQAWLNGVLVTDYQLPEGSPGYAPTGLIGLQVHGGMGEPKESAARFREIRVRELPIFGEGAGADPGWTALFDGKTLDGWEEHGTQGGWRVHDGILGCLFGKEGGDLRTKEDFRDFDLRLDFKIARMANSGVFLRARRDASNPAFSGCEVQILDDFDWEKETKTTLKEWQFTGSLYGSVPAAAREALKPIGEWNTYELLYHRSRLAVALNGRTLYDVDVLKVPGDPPFAERAKEGFIGLQHYVCAGPEGEDVVSFRNLLVRRPQ